jgi:hypothetical protein
MIMKKYISNITLCSDVFTNNWGVSRHNFFLQISINLSKLNFNLFYYLFIEKYNFINYKLYDKLYDKNYDKIDNIAIKSFLKQNAIFIQLSPQLVDNNFLQNTGNNNRH